MTKSSPRDYPGPDWTTETKEIPMIQFNKIDPRIKCLGCLFGKEPHSDLCEKRQVAAGLAPTGEPPGLSR